MLETSLNGLTVLIIEADATSPGPLTQMARDFGVCSIVTARDGADGFAAMRDKSFDMIISDYRVAPVNGLDFARRLRGGENGAHRATPVIMLAAPDERRTIEDAGDVGIHALIGKPASPSSLYSHMLSAVANPRPFVDTEAYARPDRRAAPRPSNGAASADGGALADMGVDEQAPSGVTPFIASAHHDIEAIIRAHGEAVGNPAGRRQSMRLIGCLAEIVTEQGRRSNYPLMSDIAESLHDFCRTSPEPHGGQLDVVKAHATAMSALIADQIGGAGGALGAAMLGLLRDSARRWDGKLRPVTWRRGVIDGDIAPEVRAQLTP